MPRRAAIKPIRVSGRAKPWKIEIPASVAENGRRSRYFFDTRADAANFAEEQQIRLKNFGTRGAGIATPSELEQLALATTALKPFGISINEVVADWIARRKAAETTVTFKEAFSQFEDHLAKKKIKGRHVSKSYRTQVKYTFPRFPTFHDRPLIEIDGRMIATATAEMKPSAKNAFLRVLSALFSWCAEVPREWMKDNPARHVPKESVGGAEVQTFSAAETAKLLQACIEDCELLAYHVLGFFAGIRPEELERTEWRFINLEEKAIILPAKATKTGNRRVIETNDTLAEWLRWITSRFGIQQGLIVSPVNLRKRLRTAREAAKVTWIQDAMRHTYASNWLAIHKDEHRLRDNLGHKSADELWDHYHKATTKAEATKFWKVLPPATVSVVAFQQQKGAA
jgi:integrase